MSKADVWGQKPRSHDHNLILIKPSYSGRMAAAQSDRRNAPRNDDPELRGRRSEPRAYILLPAAVEDLGGRNSVRLLDVSRTGARLEAGDLPAVGKDIILKCGAIDTLGTVVWTIHGRCGIHFDEPLRGQDLIALRALAASVEHSGMTPDELQATADWAGGFVR
ncbi:PilZ domain-containing protein [Sphingomonas sp.]|uniref:PilZ domain-containing protein n=1 Tax=Sphingomonas sp. TaxID=28214 RepID=UPI002869ED8E|nr:PilZ domain-containing protein [Sphingomonas sp.]